MADACVFLMNLDNARFRRVLDEGNGTLPPLVNIGTGVDLTIKELAERVGEATGFTGDIVFDASKPDGTPKKLLDITRLNNLGWVAKTTLAQGLTDAIKSFHDCISKQPDTLAITHNLHLGVGK
jgi:GDP-L-fucose synthase